MTRRLPVVYPGVHMLTIAAGVERCMISANRLLNRRSDFDVAEWIMDSGAFTRVSAGLDHIDIDTYAALAHRWHNVGELQAVVAQDYMCETFVLAVTGATVAQHQNMTTERFVRLRDRITGPYVMPVIQGYTPEDYATHSDAMSPYIDVGSWVGVGSVCKRQGRPDSLAAVLEAIHSVRPDWQLHGFGVKTTALRSQRVVDRLATVDSMAWSFAARYEGRDANSAEECERWLADVEAIVPDGVTQGSLSLALTR